MAVSLAESHTESHAVSALDLTLVDKIYAGGVHALRGIAMRVARGEIFGLLGPNGAGKSTLVKVVTTIVRPTRVEGTVLGNPIGHMPTLARIGYLPEHHRFPAYLTGRQCVEFFGAMTGVESSRRKRRASELLDTVGMLAWADKRLGTYSKGMQQRIGIASAMVNDPDLVILDEPTDGVDPVGRREIRDVLLNIRERGTTVFLNSHLLSEIELVCDRVAIMVQGRVARQGKIEELTRESHCVRIVFSGDSPAWAAEVGGVRAMDRGRHALEFPKATIESVQPTLDRLRSEGRVVHGLAEARESLEALFMREVTDPTSGRARPIGAEASR
ncbi:MAG: ABC transporter ATP-binding protein [Phycisphaerales bacterium]|nr:ABC transporter ATP-binding protein [Phycisphaerales bacterium]